MIAILSVALLGTTPSKSLYAQTALQQSQSVLVQVPPRSEAAQKQREEKAPRYLLLSKEYVVDFPGGIDPCGIMGNCYTRTHIEWFDSIEDAIERMNGEIPAIWQMGPNKPLTKDTFIGLFKAFPVSVRKVKVGEYEAEELVTVKVRRDKKEWRKREE